METRPQASLLPGNSALAQPCAATHVRLRASHIFLVSGTATDAGKAIVGTAFVLAMLLADEIP